MLFDPILFSVPACDHHREWQEIRWPPVALVCAQVTDRPFIREACLIFHARESSERLLKAFPASPAYLWPPLLIGISWKKKKSSYCDCSFWEAKKDVYLLGHNLVVRAANVNPVDFDWLESGGVFGAIVETICHSPCQPLLINNHTFTNGDITRQIPTASGCDKSKINNNKKLTILGALAVCGSQNHQRSGGLGASVDLYQM